MEGPASTPPRASASIQFETVLIAELPAPSFEVPGLSTHRVSNRCNSREVSLSRFLSSNRGCIFLGIVATQAVQTCDDVNRRLASIIWVKISWEVWHSPLAPHRFMLSNSASGLGIYPVTSSSARIYIPCSCLQKTFHQVLLKESTPEHRGSHLLDRHYYYLIKHRHTMYSCAGVQRVGEARCHNSLLDRP